jgi:hypothetical protein
MCSLPPGRNTTCVEFSPGEAGHAGMSHVSPGEVHTCAISPGRDLLLLDFSGGGKFVHVGSLLGRIPKIYECSLTVGHICLKFTSLPFLHIHFADVDYIPLRVPGERCAHAGFHPKRKATPVLPPPPKFTNLGLLPASGGGVMQ